MDRIEQAGDFVRHHGRAIDAALFAFHFGRGTKDDVLTALAPYQNEDGGFGHGLEPDIPGPAGNPFAVDQALRIFGQVGATPADPMVARTVDYLERTQEPDGGWRFSPAVYEHEIAPWFAAWTWPAINPSAVIAGHLRAIGAGSPELFAGVDRLFAAQANPAGLLGNEFYAVQPYAFYFLGGSNHPQRELYESGVLWWLVRQETQGNEFDAGHFFEYVPGPNSFAGRNLPKGMLDKRLDALAAEQQPDGGWPSPYAEHWRAPVTVAALCTLRAFGRV